MTREIKCYRHGELVFESVDSLPDNLEKSDSKEFLKGSHGNPHTFDNGNLYPKIEDEFIFGYFEAKDTKLYHSEHSPKGYSLPDGFYRLRRGVEFINDELKQIVD